VILVIGATGDIGSRITLKLAERAKPVRAFVRSSTPHDYLKRDGVEIVYGDLRDPESVTAALQGVKAVITTANVVAPRRGDTFAAVEGQGYAHLIEAAARSDVERMVMISVPVSPIDDHVPTFKYKRLNERRLMQSGLPYTIVRVSIIADDWLALIGSSTPLRGATASTLRRPYPFLQMFVRLTNGLVERRGIAIIPGAPTRRNAFITADDTAEIITRTVDDPRMRNVVVEVGGPDILTWAEVVKIFSSVLGRPVRGIYQPARVFRAMELALRPFAPAASNVMGLNWMAATQETPYDATVARDLGVQLTSVPSFLRARLATSTLVPAHAAS